MPFHTANAIYLISVMTRDVTRPGWFTATAKQFPGKQSQHSTEPGPQITCLRHCSLCPAHCVSTAEPFPKKITNQLIILLIPLFDTHFMISTLD